MARSQNLAIVIGWRSTIRTQTLNVNILGSTDWIQMVLALFESPCYGVYRRKMIIGIQPLDLEIFAFKDWVRIIAPKERSKGGRVDIWYENNTTKRSYKMGTRSWYKLGMAGGNVKNDHDLMQ